MRAAGLPYPSSSRQPVLRSSTLRHGSCHHRSQRSRPVPIRALSRAPERESQSAAHRHSWVHQETRHVRPPRFHSRAELLRAGRRQCTCADEESAIYERGILHVAMSYRQADRYDGAGTIDYHTAEEAYEAVLTIPLIRKYTVVRIWIDQNLHRYHHPGEWYERGFLPYTVMRVVSVLSRHGGLSVGRRRPWIWVETGLALSGIGIHCKRETMDSATEVLVLPNDSLLNSDVTESHGWILGTGYSVFISVQEALRSVAFWTPDMLEHKDYEYREDFKLCCQWAKAQSVRLTQKGKLELTCAGFEITLIEDVAWIRSLPMPQQNR